MNNDEILKAREKYKKLLLLKEKYPEIKQNIANLKNENLRRAYIEMLKQEYSIDGEINFNENIVSAAFNGIADKTVNNNRIWVFMGAYRQNGWNGTKLAENNNFDFIIEKNLETREERKLTYDELMRYPINTSEIMCCLKDREYTCYDDYLKAFEEIRNNFLEALLTHSQEEVIQKTIVR